MANTLMSVAAKATSTGSNIAAQIGDIQVVSEKAGKGFASAANSVNEFSDKSKSASESAKGLAQEQQKVSANTEQVSKSSQLAQKALQLFDAASGNVKSGLSQMQTSVTSAIDKMQGFGKVGESVGSGIKNIKSTIDSLAENLKSKVTSGFEVVTGTTQKLTSASKELVDNGFNKIKGVVETVKSSLGGFTEQQQSSTRTVADYSKALEESAKETETLKNRVEVLSGIYDEAKKNVERLTDEFNKSVQKTGAASDETRDLAKELDKAESEYQDIEKELKRYSDQADDASNSVKNLGDEESSAAQKTNIFGDTLKAMLSAEAIIGVFNQVKDAVVGFAKSSIEAGMNFDSSMSQVAATMGTTVDQIQDLRDFALEMGSKTAFSATQAADALNYMALAGYDAETSMSMLPNVLNLAAAGGMGLASASDMITDSQSALGLTLVDTSALVDKMAKASSKSNTSVAQLGEAILTVGGTAKMMAGGTTELTTALGILADNGTKGAEGGTKLRNILLSLGAPTDKAAALLKDLKVSAYDADGKLRPLKDTFSNLNRAMEGMTDARKTDIINTLFNKTDLKDVNALLATSSERWDELSSAIDNSAGAAQAMADTQLDNLAGDVTLFQSALEGVQIAISDALTPALRDFVQFGSQGLSELTEAFKSGDFGAVVDTFEGILTDGLNMLIEKLPQFISVGTDILLALVGGIVAVLPTLGTAAVEIINNLASGIADALPALIPAAYEAVMGFMMALTDPANLGSLVDGAIALIMGLADGLIAAIPILAKNAPVIIENLATAID